MRGSKRFWTLALGVALREGATDASLADAAEEMIALLRHEPVGRVRPLKAGDA